MLQFYKKAFVIIIALIIASLFCGIISLERAFLKDSLLPANKSDFIWHTHTETDATNNGQSSLSVNDDQSSIDFDFSISNKAEYPYISFALALESPKGDRHVDLSRYQSLSFSARCKPNNVIWLGLFTFEDGITQATNLTTYRLPSTYFSCSNGWRKVQVDLTRLETPQWWYSKYQVDLSKQAYRIDRVARIAFGSSQQSPFDTPSNLQINALNLHGHDWRYLYGFAALMLVLWGGYVFWFAREHTQSLVRELTEKLHKDRPLVAYQQLSIEPRRDKDTSTILRFMATEYADPELNLDTAVLKMGLSRTKINEILKQQLGYTFTAYLNKLRLTEAARLLSANDEVIVAEIAYSVGYRNVTYFNKLFKTEYACTPRIFRKTYKQNKAS
ncbi:AraC-type DNA-binding protein [Alteromonadaceae bacterium Bs31]|nr:AraC-type DNA-binding protein [Alteromonadaceae bacterium Bs31]